MLHPVGRGEQRNAPRSTQAKSMHFATLIPDWNSLDSVRRVHSDLEAAALVFFALLVLFDILAHLSTNNKKKTLLEKIGLCCFAIAVLAEVVAYPYGQRNDTLSGQIIGSLDAETREALIKSATALAQSKEAETKSGDAIDRAGKAQESLGNAETEAHRAQTESSTALSIASDAKQVSSEARQEADSFEKDIKSAKEQAAQAESHLADALTKAAVAQAELDRLRTPRSLVNVDLLVSALQPFPGTQFSISGIFGDQESVAIAEKICAVLIAAKWKPTFSPNTGRGSYSVRIKDCDVGGVGSSISTGVHIAATSEETPEALNKLAPADRPPNINAAIVLKNALARSISPTQEDLQTEDVSVDKFGKFTLVLIDVGNKPITSSNPASH